MANKYRGEITLETYLSNKFRTKTQFYYLSDIKKSINTYGLNPKGTKKELETRLFQLFKELSQYTKLDIDKISKLQKRIRLKKFKSKIKTQGIGIIDKSKCVNQEDFYTLDNINEIEDVYFFSYEKDNKIFFFDVRSFKKLLNNSTINPYTQEEIPKYAIHMFNIRMEELKKQQIIVKHKSMKLTPEQKFKCSVLNVFQKIDELNVAAGGIDIKWFINLSSIQLKMFYKTLEDIWNYRANLDVNAQKLIVPENDAFTMPVYQVCSINNIEKRKLQIILLNTINKLIASSPDNIHCSTGCYYVLTALVEISHDCASALPWLVQYN